MGFPVLVFVSDHCWTIDDELHLCQTTLENYNPYGMLLFAEFPQSFGQDVLGGIAPRVNRLDVNRLANYMLSRRAISRPQYQRLIEPHCTSEQRAQQLNMVLSTAIWDEDPSQFIKDFYLALCDLYEDDGQRSHYQFVHFLRGKGRECVLLHVCVCACVCLCVCARVRACVRACMRACVRACVRAYTVHILTCTCIRIYM